MAQRVRQAGERKIRVGPHMRRKVGQHLCQLFRRAGGDREQPPARRIGNGHRLRRRFLQHQMHVGAAGPEGADGRPARLRDTIDHRRWPGRERCLRHEGRAGEIRLRIGRAGPDRGRQFAVLKLQQHLGQLRHARRRLGMAHIGLHRADGAEPRLRREGAEGTGQRPQLNGVAEDRAVGRRLDIGDGPRIHPGGAQILLDQPCLRLGAGHRIAGGMAGMVGRTRLHHGQHRIAIAPRIGQRLQQHRPHAFRRQIAIAIGETAAVGMAADQPGAAQRQIFVRDDREIHPAGDGQPAFAQPQALAGLMHRLQPGGAHAVHRDAGALQIEEIGQPVGDASIGGQVQQRLAVGIHLQRAVLLVHRADEHADA